MAALNTYLNFPGTTEEAFSFYKSVFGGEFTMFQRFSDTPHGSQMPETDRNKIMHVSLPVGAHSVLMATDAVESMGQALTFGNSSNISVAPDTKEEAFRLFDALSAGGAIEMPLEKMFWGAYYGNFTDKYGVRWMINYEDTETN